MRGSNGRRIANSAEDPVRDRDCRARPHHRTVERRRTGVGRFPFSGARRSRRRTPGAGQARGHGGTLGEISSDHRFETPRSGGARGICQIGGHARLERVPELPHDQTIRWALRSLAGDDWLRARVAAARRPAPRAGQRGLALDPRRGQHERDRARILALVPAARTPRPADGDHHERSAVVRLPRRRLDPGRARAGHGVQAATPAQARGTHAGPERPRSPGHRHRRTTAVHRRRRRRTGPAGLHGRSDRGSLRCPGPVSGRRPRRGA